MNNSVCEYKIEIKNTPEDIYKAVGQVTELAQDWEKCFKEFARLVGIKVKKEKQIEKYSLKKLNEAMKSNGILEERVIKDFEEIISKRNYINHTFFLDFKAGRQGDLAEEFTDTATYICDATDYIQNKIGELQGNATGRRPTVFDKGAVFE